MLLTPYMAAKMVVKEQLNEQRIISVFSTLEWVEAFIIDRKSRGLSPNTIPFYRKKLKNFLKYCEIAQVYDIQELKAADIRKYILWLKARVITRVITRVVYMPISELCEHSSIGMKMRTNSLVGLIQFTR